MKPYEEWALWLENNRNERHLGNDTLSDGTRISTVFMGLDLSFLEYWPPVLWETMIFGGPHDQYQERYTSKEAAIKGHEKALRIARGEENITQEEENS